MSLYDLMNSNSGAAASADAGGAGGAGVTGDGGGAPGGAAEAPLVYADWMNTFGADPLEDGGPSARDYIAKKGFKTADDVAKSLRETERALHSRIPIPKPEETDKWGEVWNKLGRPEAPDQYKIGAPDGFQPDPTFTKPFSERAHAAGLTQAQVEQMVGWWNETAIQSIEQQRAAVDGQISSLKSEWGTNYDKNVQFMNRGAATLGLDKTGVDKLGQALGVDGAAKMLANLGLRVGEDLLHQGDSVVTSLSVEELKAELQSHVRENGIAIRSGDPTAKATHQRLIAQLAAAEKARSAKS